MRAAVFLVAIALTLPPAARGGAGEAANLYQATVIVTGTDMRSRPAGFVQAFKKVLVNVSGEPRLGDDRRVAALGGRAGVLVTSYSYVDRMAGRPVHDEQGTRDRPYNLTVRFAPEGVDRTLADLGEHPWRGPRPVIVPVLTVRGLNGASYLLSAEGLAGADQRAAFADMARDFVMKVRFPPESQFAAWGIEPAQEPSLPASPENPAEARVAGRLEFDPAVPGWAGTWHLRRHGIDYRWSIRGVNYDEAFRDIIRGVLRVASDHGAPD